jgi:rfaE bifunctional protein nucleotidyltransferase chain/domain/rfaE bifunctional protein kinase chain/domain
MTGPLVVVGDCLLDVDVEGQATRLCPDAPVPVLSDPKERARPGGAALAAELAARDGHQVVLVTALADDDDARRLAGLLSPSVRLVGLPCGGSTPVKRRVRAAGQSLVRIDSGAAGAVGEVPKELVAIISQASAVLVSDYGQGLTDAGGIRAALSAALSGARRVPLVWDPHPRGARPVPGVWLATPNQAEAAAWSAKTGVPVSEGIGVATLHASARALVREWRAQAVCITMGERGALLSTGGDVPVVVPAPGTLCVDSCGAGDRFAVSVALSFAEGAVTSEAVQSAVAASSAFVARGGAGSLLTSAATSPHADGSPARPGTVVATGGCFDLLHAGHVSTLRAARRLGDRLVVCVNSDDSVRRLKGPTRPVVPQADRVRVLEALECVDEVVVFDEDTPVDVLRMIRPDVWAKGGDYAGSETPEASVVTEWGGQAVVLPYLSGRSTTGLLRAVGAVESQPSQGRSINR